MPLCTYVSDGCQGLTPPFFTNQVVGNDVFGACNDSYRCDEEGDAGGVFYHGIYTEGDWPTAFTRLRLKTMRVMEVVPVKVRLRPV